MSAIRIAESFSLPPEAVTETFAILAKRGAGKTYTASVMAEEMLSAGYRTVVLDPIGVWHGLRSSADGRSEGLPVVIFGGDHGDVPLEETSGSFLADLIVDESVPAILDLSLFSKRAQARFVADFSERLYRRNRDPLHVFVDEADSFVPQKIRVGQERMVGAIDDLVRRGRARGIGLTLITQRSAVINKDVLTQCEVLIALRTNHPRDRDAIDEWVKVHGESGQREELMASLAGLPIGTAWIWSAGWLNVFRKIQIRQRKTFDSSATPKIGEKRPELKHLAPVDLQRIQDLVATTIERVKAEDPKTLRARIADLERQLKQKHGEPKVIQVETPVEVPVFADGELLRLEQIASTLSLAGSELQDASRSIVEAISRTLILSREQMKTEAETKLQEFPKASQRDDKPVSLLDALEASVTAEKARKAQTNGSGLGKTERKVLTVLAQHGERTHAQLALQTGYSAKASTIGVALSKLRRLGYVEPTQPIRATAEGIAALGTYESLPEGRDLLDYWRGWLGGTERNVLDALLGRYPDDMTHEELCNVTGYSPNASTVGVALSKLRKLGLVEARVRRVTDEFMNVVN